MYCKNCGKALAGDEKFCSNCGTKVEYDSYVNAAEDGVEVVESLPKTNLVWDLDDFDDRKVGSGIGEKSFNWGANGLFQPNNGQETPKVRDDYKGPLMFRKEDKAPSREEIQQREKEEETTKKSTLYKDDGNLGEGDRWDISNVEIPEPYVSEEAVEPEAESDQGLIMAADAEALDHGAWDIDDDQVKAEIQAAIDDAIEKVEPANFNWDIGENNIEDTPKVEPKKVVIDWNKEPEEEPESPELEEIKIEEPVVEETVEPLKETVVSEAENDTVGEFYQTKAAQESLDGLPEDENVVDNNLSMTLEELVAGGNETEDKVPKSNYDESKKTIRNVLSKIARRHEPAFVAEDEIKPEVETKIEPEVEPEVVGFEQPKASNISLKIEEDENGEKVETLLEDDPKTPTESLQTVPVFDDEPLEEAEDAPLLEDAPLEDETDNLEEERCQKERFYTFNKNKEEFQKLLDQEYKRLEGNTGEGKGFEEDIESFMNVERGKCVEATSQIEEMNKARSVFINGPDYGDVTVLEEDDYKESDFEVDSCSIDVLEESLESEEPKEPEELKEPEITEESKETDESCEIDKEPEIKELDVEDLAEVPHDEKVTVVFEPQTEESLVETFIENEQAKEQAKEKGEEPKLPLESVEKPIEKVQEEHDEDVDYLHGGVSKMIIDPNDKLETERLANEFFDEEDEEEGGGVKKFFLGLLGVIVVIAVAVAGIKFILPESPVAKVMDDLGATVMETINGVLGGEEKDVENQPIRETAIEDKDKLVEGQVDKNYKNQINEIKYDESLTYDSDATYDLVDLKDAKDIQTILWYKNQNGTPYYYDEELTGAIIEYISMRTAWVNLGDKAVLSILKSNTQEYKTVSAMETGKSEKTLDQLCIGDIKVAGNSYYVWVSETLDDKTTKHVYEIKEQDLKLYVNDHCDI